MGQSLVKNYVHIVFSTKYRQPLITTDIETELYSYLGGICNGLGCPSVKVGGFDDHVHILCMLSKNIALANLMKELKANSSKWIKTKGPEFKNFYWQNGYGAFSVPEKGVPKLIDYIANQRQKHQKLLFHKEYLQILKEHDIDYDERYLWD